MAETIENNIRRIIIEENPVNPRYYDQMSDLLDALIEERRRQAISYQEYLEQVKQLATQVKQPAGTTRTTYPPSLNTAALRSLYDNLEQNEALALKIDTAVGYTKKDGWVGNRFKEREVAKAVREEAVGCNINVDTLLELVKHQREYQ